MTDLDEALNHPLYKAIEFSVLSARDSKWAIQSGKVISISGTPQNIGIGIGLLETCLIGIGEYSGIKPDYPVCSMPDNLRRVDDKTFETMRFLYENGVLQCQYGTALLIANSLESSAFWAYETFLSEGIRYSINNLGDLNPVSRVCFFNLAFGLSDPRLDTIDINDQKEYLASAGVDSSKIKKTIDLLIPEVLSSSDLSS